MWIDVPQANGQSLRKRATDRDGNQIYHYEAPEGFVNHPSYDHTDHYVRVDERGRVLRDVHGNAMEIREGTALVENADGTSEVLEDDYARHLFTLAHDKTTVVTPKKTAPAKSTGSEGK